MMRTAFVLVGLALAFWTSAVRAGDPEPKGKPAGMEAGQPVRWYVWHDKNGWHVRTTTKSKEHEFTGTIRVLGGAVNHVHPAKMEGKSKQKDWWALSEGNKVVTLKLKTDGGMDGFDFEVGPSAKEIVFALKVDGKDDPKHIHIGKQGDHPDAAKFTLPAHPGGKK